MLEFSYETLKKRFEELAYLNRGLIIECIDERIGETHIFHAEGGIRQFVADLNSGEQGIHSIIFGEGVIENVSVDFALQYNAGYKENILTFANNIRTKEGGTHLVGFRTALTRAINGYIKHYPDIMIMTQSGKVIFAETKGEHLKNDNSREKIELGRAWRTAAGSQYRYYMVFRDGENLLPGAVSMSQFVETIKAL